MGLSRVARELVATEGSSSVRQSELGRPPGLHCLPSPCLQAKRSVHVADAICDATVRVQHSHALQPRDEGLPSESAG